MTDERTAEQVGQWCMDCDSDMIASAKCCSLCGGPLLRRDDPEYLRINPDSDAASRIKEASRDGE